MTLAILPLHEEDRMGLFDSVKKAIGGAAKVAQDTVQQQVQPQQAQQPQQQQQHYAQQPQQAAPAPSAAPQGRNYAQEEQDDAASFDLLGDLPGWYTAEFRIEQAWEDEGTKAQLFGEYSIRDEQH